MRAVPAFQIHNYRLTSDVNVDPSAGKIKTIGDVVRPSLAIFLSRFNQPRKIGHH